MRHLLLQLFTVLLASSLFVACDSSNQRPIPPVQKVQVQYPEWVKSAVIYEVNIRQFTPEGTFRAFQEHLPRLKAMGVDVLWLMPVHAIGEVNRKGSLGSYYAIKNHHEINPEFGSPDDFKVLVKAIHDQGMYVILDWVANHTSWDHEYMKRHPDYYTRNEKNEIVPPVEDWTDVADLNYDNVYLNVLMAGAMAHNLETFDLDGFRCDVASMVPIGFWEKVRGDLELIKPVFMLAEAEEPALLEKAFDADYGWELHHLFNKIASKEVELNALREYYLNPTLPYPPKAIKMNFTSNHDENSWNGTEFERLKDSYEAFAALSYFLPGMPLIYSGQEAGNEKRLRFFDKDTIEWKEHKMAQVYQTLGAIKKANPALWNGQDGGAMNVIPTTQDQQVFAFTRDLPESSVLVFFNLSSEPAEFSFNTDGYRGKWTNLFTNEELKVKKEFSMKLEPWSYQAFSKQNQ